MRAAIVLGMLLAVGCATEATTRGCQCKMVEKNHSCEIAHSETTYEQSPMFQAVGEFLSAVLGFIVP